MMPPWLAQISSAQKKESKLDNRFIQLATVGIDKTPRVRTVVFRGWSESYELIIFTDIRSQKYKELNLNNKVEICWLFSKAKCQFRLNGISRFDLGKDSKRYWEQLSENSKSTWSWPCPGDKFEFDQTNDSSINSRFDASDNFALIKVEITQVDQLHLHKPIHTRRMWVLKKGWTEERINP